MPAPTTEFRSLANNLATTALDTRAERKTAAAAGTLVDASGSNPLDMGLVSIAGAVAPVRSGVRHLVWHVTDYEGNTEVSNFRGWFQATHWGFDQDSVQKYKALRYEAGANGTAYVQNATDASYGGHATWDEFDVNANPPGSQNLFAGDGALSFGAGDDDIVGFQTLLEVAEDETSGTYLGTSTGYEYRYSLRFDYN